MRPAATALLSFLCGLTSAGVVAAAEPEPAPATEHDAPRVTRTAVVDGGPHRLLLASGAATFAFSYGASLWVGATTTRASDRALLVPFAGPWLAFGLRGACGESAVPCGQQATYGALLVADGLVQAASAVQIALAFLHRELREQPEPALRSARITLAPSRPLGGGVALAAVGQF